MLRVSVLHPLDDVDSLFLGDPSSRPGLAANETMWLDNTAIVLSLAEQEFARLSKLIDQYGGPQNVRTVG